MKISELIQELEQYKTKYGDHEIYKQTNYSEIVEPVTRIMFGGGRRCVLYSMQKDFKYKTNNSSQDWVKDCEENNELVRKGI